MSALKPYNNAIMNIYRYITGNQFNSEIPMISDADVLFNYNLTSPSVIVASSRLQLLGRISAKSVGSLLSIIMSLDFSYQGWPAALKNDFQWLCGLDVYTPYIKYSLPQWMDLIAINPKLFIKNVRNYSLTPLANIFYNVVSPLKGPKLNNNILCHYCDVYFPSNQQHALHMFKAHRIKNPIRLYISTNHCTVCLKMFHTRERVLNHLRYRSHICRSNLLLKDPVLSVEEADILDTEVAESNRKLQATGKRRHTKCYPCYQISGPIIPPLGVIAPSCHHPLGRGHNHY
jgi:hypothetical protein